MLLTYTLVILIILFIAMYSVEEFWKLVLYIELEIKYAWIKARMWWMAQSMKRQLKRDLKRIDKLTEEIRNNKDEV
jgi:hypothetical protein